MIKSILLAVDGSNYTESVLKYGVHFAQKFDAHLKVLNVIDVRIFEWSMAIGVEGFAPVIPSSAYQEESQKLLEQRAEKVLKKTESMLKDKNIDFSTERESGNPVDLICEKARLVDMLVMGARGEFAKWSDKMLGVTLEAATRLCIKPILVTHKDFKEIKKIMIAYDGSENASRALTLSAHFASNMNLPLIVLTVNGSDEETKELLSNAREYLNPYHISNVEEVVREGEAHEQIVETAEEYNADLIFMGSYGHSRIREAILGSTTVQVMRNSAVPILMAR